MAFDAGTIKSKMVIEKKAWERSAREINKTQGKMASQARRTGTAFKTTWKQMAAGIAVVYGLTKSIQGLTRWMGDAVDKAAAQELAEKEVQAALESTGREVENNTEHFKSYASSLQAATTYGDEQVLSAQALLIQLTRLDRDGLDEATKGAIGLASVYKQDLQAATVLVGKALAGNYGALSRYGIMVERTMTDEEKRASILSQLQKMYQRAEAETFTYQGAVKQLSNTYGDLKEEVGKAITENEDFRESIQLIHQVVRDFIDSGALQEWIDMFAEGVKWINQVSGWIDSLKLVGLHLAIDAAEARKLREEQEMMNEQIEKWSTGLDVLIPKQTRIIEPIKMMGIELEKVNFKLDTFTDLLADPEAAYAFQLSMAQNEEATQKWLDKQLESLGIYGAQAGDIIKTKTDAELSSMDKIGAGLQMISGFSKETAIASALVNTYQGISKTIAMLGMPWALPFIPIALASGLKQVSMIQKQSVPALAEGAVFERPTYLVGEGREAEVLSPLSKLPELFERTGGAGMAGASMRIIIQNKITIGEQTFYRESVKNISNAYKRKELIVPSSVVV